MSESKEALPERHPIYEGIPEVFLREGNSLFCLTYTVAGFADPSFTDAPEGKLEVEVQGGCYYLPEEWARELKSGDKLTVLCSGKPAHVNLATSHRVMRPDGAIHDFSNSIAIHPTALMYGRAWEESGSGSIEDCFDLLCKWYKDMPAQGELVLAAMRYCLIPLIKESGWAEAWAKSWEIIRSHFGEEGRIVDFWNELQEGYNSPM